MASLKVGIVGAGSVGSKLGGQLHKAKPAVALKYGVRNPSSDKFAELLAAQPAAAVDEVQAVVAWADAIILAVPGANDDAGIQAIAASLGPDVKGKVVIDATNPLSPWPQGLQVRWTQGTSGGEVLAAALPESFVYKAFNTLGAEMMEVPDGSTLNGERLTLLFAGPPEKLSVAEQVIAGAGYVPSYVGGIRYSRNLEAIAELWIHLGVPGLPGSSAADWGRNFHFQVVRK